MTDRPTTAAGRLSPAQMLADLVEVLTDLIFEHRIDGLDSPPDWDQTGTLSRFRDRLDRANQWVAMGEAEARQPDSEALRAALTEPNATSPPWTYRAVADAFLYGMGDFPPSPANVALAVKAVNALAALPLAALPPSAPPALDADRLAEALKPVTRASWPSEPKESQEQWRRRTADAIAAEYARLSQPPAEPTDPATPSKKVSP